MNDFFKGLGAKLESGFDSAAVSGRQLLNKVQGVETTKDERYEETKKLFDQHVKTVEKMLQGVKMQDNGLSALSNGLTGLSTSLVAFNGSENRVPGALDFSNTNDAFQNTVETYLERTRNVEANLKSMIEYLGQIKKRTLERDRLLIDYDKARHDLASEQKKAETNPSQSLPLLQKKHDERWEAYREKNEEAINEMNQAYATRNVFSEVQSLVQAIASFMATSAQQFNQLNSRISTLEPPKINYVPPPQAYAPPQQHQQQYQPPQQQQPPPQQRPAPQPQQGQPAQQPFQHRPAPTVKKARALYPFKGETPTELSFNPNDVLTILNTDHPEWWLAEMNGNRGEIPANYVQLL